MQAEVERVPNELYGERLAVRKGSGRFLLSVQGQAQAAHAGVNPEAGISAVEELARQIIRLRSWSDADCGIQVNVDKIAGGIGANVIADDAEAEIDVRADTMDDFRRFPGRLNGLAPSLPGTRLRIGGGMNRPPLERTASAWQPGRS